MGTLPASTTTYLALVASFLAVGVLDHLARAADSASIISSIRVAAPGFFRAEGNDFIDRETRCTAVSTDEGGVKALQATAHYPKARFEIWFRFTVDVFPSAESPRIDIDAKGVPSPNVRKGMPRGFVAVWGGHGGGVFVPDPVREDSLCSIHALLDAKTDALVGSAICQNVAMLDPREFTTLDSKEQARFSFSAQEFQCPIDRRSLKG